METDHRGLVSNWLESPVNTILRPLTLPRSPISHFCSLNEYPKAALDILRLLGVFTCIKSTNIRVCHPYCSFTFYPRCRTVHISDGTPYFFFHIGGTCTVLSRTDGNIDVTNVPSDERKKSLVMDLITRGLVVYFLFFLLNLFNVLEFGQLLLEGILPDSDWMKKFMTYTM